MNYDTNINLLRVYIKCIYQHKMCDCPINIFKPLVLEGLMMWKNINDFFSCYF